MYCFYRNEHKVHKRCFIDFNEIKPIDELIIFLKTTALTFIFDKTRLNHG
jgi:hypothetical protein